LVSLVHVLLGSKPIEQGILGGSSTRLGAGTTSIRRIQRFRSPERRVGHSIPDTSGLGRQAAEFTARHLSMVLPLPLLCGGACSSPKLFVWYPLSTQHSSIPQEPLASVALELQRKPLVPQLVPQLVEVRVVRPNLDVTQLMQHGVEAVLKRHKGAAVVRVPEPHHDLLAMVDVEAEEVMLVGIELAQGTDAPAAFSHNGLHARRDFAQSGEGVFFVGHAAHVRVLADQAVEFGHLAGESCARCGQDLGEFGERLEKVLGRSS
jgi:hypothetical protein